MNVRRVLNSSIAPPATEMAASAGEKSRFIIKPGPYNRVPSSEIVRSVSISKRDEVVLADLGPADLRENYAGFKAAGSAVTVTPSSPTQS